MEKAVIDLGIKERMPGATFVALSRLRSLSDAIIAKFPLEHFVRMRRHRHLEGRLQEEARLRIVADRTLQLISEEELL